jgi:site-specific DNA-adenine methylase
MTKEIYHLSVLKNITQSQITEKKEIMLENSRRVQNESKEIILDILKKYIKKSHISAWIYRILSLVTYSKDYSLHEKIKNLNNLSDKSYLYNFLRNKSKEIINTDSFSDDTDTKRFAFLPYGGGKQKHKGIQQSILTSMLLKNPKQFKLYYEPFVGGFGSVYNSLPLLIKNGIKDIYLSDLNPSLINAYKQVQKNPKQVQRHLASFELNYYRAHNKFYPTTKEEGKELFEKLHKEFTHLETKKRMNPKRAALFLYLIHNTQGGMLSFNMDNQTNKFTFCYCQNKLKQIPLIINKVEIYNKIFNLGNIKFSIKKYETVLNKIKNDSTALVLFDPPYVNYEEISTSKDFTNCSYNYGINDFNHRKLLNKIKDSKYSFIYYNNHNPHLENFAKDENYNYVKKDVIYKNGTVGKKCVEILMFKDRVGKEIKTVNFTNFKQIEIKQAS